MNGFDIALKYQVVQYHYEEMLREAAMERAAAEAVTVRPHGNTVDSLRAFVASALLRAGSWLMPDDCMSPAGHGLELRPGR